MTGLPTPPASRSSRPDKRASVATASTSGTAASRRRTRRSLPPWISSYEARHGAPTEDELRALATPPQRSLPARRNNTPQQLERKVSKDGYVDMVHPIPHQNANKVTKFLNRKSAAERGRQWDHLRSAEPVIVPGYMAASSNAQWRAFLQSSQYGHLPNEEAEIVDPEVLDKLQPGFNNPVDIPPPQDANRTRGTRRQVLYKRIWNHILNDPFVPLVFRLTVLLTSILGLALSGRMYETEFQEGVRESSERTDSLIAIVVDTVAIPYIGYMTWDEYTGKPLGLRPPTQKISLILMDLLFIIFKSVSATLAFETLLYHPSIHAEVNRYSQALAAFLTVGLIAWTFTFSVNVFRLVQRLGGGDEEDRGS
ncbi:hypothetical protein GQ53DRAFT_845965 [Thozetella sp. PMI_491]|nr:hypothetical protein GQ53DRAFT_845965 [Thozetella sp. PMI_491]